MAASTVTWGNGSSTSFSDWSITLYPHDEDPFREEPPLVEMEENNDQLRIKDY